MGTDQHVSTAEPQQSSSDEPETALETARRQLARARSNLEIDDAIHERLRYPRAVHEVTVPLERDDGSVDVFTGYRAQHDSVRGPTRADSGTIRRLPVTSVSGWRCG